MLSEIVSPDPLHFGHLPPGALLSGCASHPAPHERRHRTPTAHPLPRYQKGKSWMSLAPPLLALASTLLAI